MLRPPGKRWHWSCLWAVLAAALALCLARFPFFREAAPQIPPETFRDGERWAHTWATFTGLVESPRPEPRFL